MNGTVRNEPWCGGNIDRFTSGCRHEARSRNAHHPKAADIRGGHEVAEQEFLLQSHNDEYVVAEERSFVVRMAGQPLSQNRWPAIDIGVMTSHPWWSVEQQS